MPLLLVLLFIGVPILEIAVFIQAGKFLGLWPTLAAVVLTAIIGVALLRMQGLAALKRARQSLDKGILPVDEVFTGACLLVGGALLLTPGFVTDLVGFFLLIPPIRRVIGSTLLSALFRTGHTRVWVDGEEVINPGYPGPDAQSGAIDVDYTDITDQDPNDERRGEGRH